jgi:hypothetical protein
MLAGFHRIAVLLGLAVVSVRLVLKPFSDDFCVERSSHFPPSFIFGWPQD